MPRLWWLPYTVFALLGAPAISIALTGPAAYTGVDVLYVLITVGIPVALVVAVVVERRSRVVFVAALALAALVMCLVAQIQVWSGVS